MNLVKKSNGGFPSVVDDFFKPQWFEDFPNFGAFGVNAPAVNIKETDRDFMVELAVPGKKKEDFKIEMDNKVLSISSEAKTEREEKDVQENYTRREFSFSSFKRAFTLPESVDEGHIKATYEDGVLNIVLPKRQASPSNPKRTIQIS